MTDLPYRRSGRYGVATLDRAACGKGYVVTYRATAWVAAHYGDRSCWHTFLELHTALAYLNAVTGPAVGVPGSEGLSSVPAAPMRRPSLSVGFDQVSASRRDLVKAVAMAADPHG